MPYTTRKTKKGCVKVTSPTRTLSKCTTKQKAAKQIRAIEASKHQKLRDRVLS